MAQNEAAWESLKRVRSNYVGREKSPDFSDGIQTLQIACKEIGCRIHLNIIFAFNFTFLS